MADTNSLVSSFNLVQTPFISVKIGEYTFGAYEKVRGISGEYSKYPNYVESLEIRKINGQVNTYTLRLNYAINEHSDPNYFEKVFSSVNKSRRIEFSYGDMSTPNFLYRNEVAMLTNVKSNFNLENSVISYTVSAVGQATLATSGAYAFEARKAKPSDIIREILTNKKYGLQDLFTGMRDMDVVDKYNLIPANDVAVDLEMKSNVSVLEYLQYLVNSMTPIVGDSSIKKSNLYVLTFVDDTSGVFNGSYFKIIQTDTAKKHPEAYQLDIGWPGNNYVYNFSVENDENYSIYYDYQTKLHPQDYVSRIAPNGDYEEVYAPTLSSGNNQYRTEESDKTWWSRVTQYPIKVSLDIKGVLRPAVLMSYVRLNVWFYGQRHINSGLYIITKQVDRVNDRGYSTTLNMIRVGED